MQALEIYFSCNFTSFKLNNMFSVKDTIPNTLRSQVVYKFTCAGCHTCYVGETTRHFGTRAREHLLSDRNSHIYKHLQGSESCKNLCSFNCFSIYLDSALTNFQLKGAVSSIFSVTMNSPKTYLFQWNR